MWNVGLLLAIGVLLVQPEKDKPAPKKEYSGQPSARQVHYSGKVQGVGFRLTAERIARDFPVTGWVKNLPDGRVELVAEGKEDAVVDFLKAIRKRWKANIEKEQVEKPPVTNKYKKFTVAE